MNNFANCDVNSFEYFFSIEEEIWQKLKNEVKKSVFVGYLFIAFLCCYTFFIFNLDMASLKKEDLPLYGDLVKFKKTLNNKQIELADKSSRPDWIYNSSAAHCNEHNADLQFIVEQKKIEFRRYKVQLRHEPLHPRPFYRLDSDGAAHRNKNEKGELKEQQVKTPHFNCFDKDGNEWAYQTEILKDEKASKAIVENIDFGIVHFCKETNVRYGEDDYPETTKTKKQLELGLDFDRISSDPLKSINFKL